GARVEWSPFFAQHERHLGALVDKVLYQRSCLNHAILKSNSKVLAIDIFGQPSIEDNDDSPFIFGGELAHSQPLRSRCCLPVDMPPLVTCLIVAQQEQIVTKAASKRSRLAGEQRQEVHLVRDRLRPWINDDIDLARLQTPPVPEKPERKTSRELKAGH